MKRYTNEKFLSLSLISKSGITILAILLVVTGFGFATPMGDSAMYDRDTNHVKGISDRPIPPMPDDIPLHEGIQGHASTPVNERGQAGYVHMQESRYGSPDQASMPDQHYQSKTRSKSPGVSPCRGSEKISSTSDHLGNEMSGKNLFPFQDPISGSKGMINPFYPVTSDTADETIGTSSSGTATIQSLLALSPLMVVPCLYTSTSAMIIIHSSLQQVSEAGLGIYGHISHSTGQGVTDPLNDKVRFVPEKTTVTGGERYFKNSGPGTDSDARDNSPGIESGKHGYHPFPSGKHLNSKSPGSDGMIYRGNPGHIGQPCSG